EDLAPADTATLDPTKVLALVTSGGGPQSHTAIIARSLGLPAIAAALGAQGVGLFRTEFCFLERDTEPTVEEQASAYKGVFDAFPGQKVALRTLDAGADKPLPFLTDATEPNPALG